MDVSPRPWPTALVVLAALALAACSTRSPSSPPLATPNPDATPTPTPFSPGQFAAEPQSAAPMPIHNPDGTWSGFPGPSESSVIEIPPPMPAIPMEKGVINVLLLGSDSRPGFYGSRTDTIIILSLDRSAKRVRMISLPRDLYVYLPGWKVNRINTADQHAGPGLVSMAILYNLGIEVHHWVRVSFNGFISAVNSLGGIDIDVPATIVDECDEKMVRFPAGRNHMDGYTALCYARVRKASSDFARARRQQQVIEAVFNKALSLGGLTKIPELYREFGELVETDMGLGDIVALVPLASSVARDPSRLEGYTIEPPVVTPWRVPGSGAYVLLPERDQLRGRLIEIFSE
jgi:LCP family protein required for cell wall assembly